MRNIPKLLLFFLTLHLSSINAQNPWLVTSYGGDGGVPVHGNTTAAQDQVVCVATKWRDGIIYVWRDNRNGNRDIYAQKLDPCGNVAPGWPVGGLAICTSTGNQQLPRVIADTSDGAFIVWEDNRGPNQDIYGTHVRGNGTIWPGWTANGTALCTATGSQDNPVLTSLANGNVVFAWDDARSGNRDVYAVCYDWNGGLAPGWAANGTGVAVVANTQQYPVITPDGLGGVFLAWEDNRPGSQGIDVYGANITSLGAINWTNYIASVTGAQQDISITNVAPGIAMAAWINASTDCVHTTRFDNNGNPTGIFTIGVGNNGIVANCGWGAGGIRSRIVPDGNGGAYISFRSNYGSGDNDIWAGIVSATGTISNWGCVHCMFDNEQNHEMIDDGTGKMYTAVQNPANDWVGPDWIQAVRHAPQQSIFAVTYQTSGGNGPRQFPSVTAMCGVGYWAWQDSRPTVVGTWDIYSAASDTLAPPATLLSSLSTGCSTCCPPATQNFTVCQGTSITFTSPLPRGLFNTYTFYDGVTVLQTGSSNTFTTSTLTPGLHPITVVSTTSSGCSTRGSNIINITVTAPPTLAPSQTNVSCNGGNNGTATITPTGNGPFTYLWNPSGQTTQTATGLSANTYTVTVTDANGCTSTQTITITQPSGMSVTPSQTNVLCNGGNNATATVNVTGGQGPYTYLWNPSGQTTQTATGLSATTYTVTITDANGCTQTQTFTITQPSALSATASQNNVSCNGGGNGTATATPSGGTSPYTYLWSNGQTTQTATSLSANTYTVTVTDANGCTTQQIITISQPSALSATTSQVDVLCNLGNNGSGTANPSGGTGPYTYLWSNGQTTQTATGLSANIYTVTVTDANGCTTQQIITITQPSAITTNSSATNTSCTSSTGTAITNPSGGVGPYTYLWSPGGQTSQTATGLSAGTYTVVITDANGCTFTDNNIVVSTVNGPSANIASQTNPQCNGQTTGTANLNVTGGQGPYTYLWTPSGQTTQNATGLAANVYTVVITDANGCTVTQIVTITEPPLLTAGGSGTDPLCNGGTNGSVTVAVSGGVGPYTYLWNPGGFTTQTVTGLTSGTYTVVSTDANGCTVTQTVTLNQPSVITAVLSSTGTNCGSNSGTATVNASGGVGPYTYVWNPSGQTTTTATGLSPMQYTIVVTDANGCTYSDTISVQGSGGPTLTAQVVTNPSCFNASNGSAIANPTGGTSPYTYLWSPGGQTTQTATGLAAGTYTVVVTDANGCTSSQTVVITAPPQITTSTSSTPDNCNQSNGTATVNVSGGTSPYTYLWSNSATTTTISGLVAGTYTVVITDANGCTVTQTITVPSAPGPNFTLSNNVTIQHGNSTTLTASGATTYSWSPSTGLSCTNCASPTASPQQTTTYCVFLSDANGCSDSACVTVTVEAPCNMNLLETLMPTGFSPNNDGKNDALCVPENACIKSFVLKIYNRWGEKVFETETIDNCWDGVYKGSAQTTGVFVYYFNAILTSGEKYNQQGNISLVR